MSSPRLGGGAPIKKLQELKQKVLFPPPQGSAAIPGCCAPAQRNTKEQGERPVTVMHTVAGRIRVGFYLVAFA